VGTSGWQYSSWRGRFYPDRLPQRAWLAFYAKRFATVEVNATFYHLLPRRSFEGWRDVLPEGFVVAVKASRYLTHVRRLSDPREPVGRISEAASGLGEKLGPVLYQLPPHFPCDVGLLAGLLAVLPAGQRPAFEFRDPSWFVTEAEEMLIRRGAARVVADRRGKRDAFPASMRFAYVRFHEGERGPGYSRAALAAWAEELSGLDVEEIFCYFNNDTDAWAPRNALLLMDLLARRGVEVARPLEAGSS